jgi:hypothetical protein
MHAVEEWHFTSDFVTEIMGAVVVMQRGYKNYDGYQYSHCTRITNMLKLFNTLHYQL